MTLTKQVTAWTKLSNIDRLVERAPGVLANARAGDGLYALTGAAADVCYAVFAQPERAWRELGAYQRALDLAIASEATKIPASERVGKHVLTLLELAGALQSVGLPCAAVSTQTLRGWLPRIAGSRDDAHVAEYWTTGFAALALDEPSYRRHAALDRSATPQFNAGETFEYNLQGLMRHLAGAVAYHAKLAEVMLAWEGYLENVLDLEAAGSVDPGTTIWIAHTVYHRIGGLAVSSIGVRMHDDIWHRAGLVT